MRGAMAAAWLDDRDDATLYLARGRLRPLWVATTGRSLYFASTRRALAIVAAALRTRLDVREVREGRLLHVVAGRVERERRFRPDRRYREDRYLPPVRAPREAVSCLERFAALASVSRRLELHPRERLLPPRGDARERGTGTLSTRRVGRRACDRPATPRGARDPPAARRPSRPSSAGVRDRRRAPPLLDGALEACLALEDLEPGLAEGVPERAERVRVERRGRERAASRCEVARRWGSPELVAEGAELLEELVTREEAPWEEPGGTLRRVPGAEVLDDRLRVNACRWILCELSHRRRSPQALRCASELVQDLVVRVAPPHSSAKRGQLGLVDAHLTHACWSADAPCLQRA